MAAINSAADKLSFALLYGAMEGRRHGREFTRLMKRAGFVEATPTKADIIIAHSSGYVSLPLEARPRLVVYVGMPLALDKMFLVWLQANWQVLKLMVTESLPKLPGVLFHHVYYTIRHPRRNLRLIKGSRGAASLSLPSAPTLFIINRHDPWPWAPKLIKYLDEGRWTFISLPGSHDNIWQHPERYVAIIKQYARLLAKTDQR